MGADASTLGSEAPLEGVVVVDATTFLAGPFGGLMLADLGAEVIKVESPSHDPLRRMKSPWHPASPMAASVNRNKRSIVVDIKEPHGRDEFYDLIRGADVAIFNMRASAAALLGVDDTTLATLNNGLIRAWISGYGQTGPRKAAPAFDSAVQAYSGMIEAQTGGGEPAPIRTYVADKVSGMFLVQGVLAALLKRATSGLGERIDIAMLDAAAYFSFPDLFEDHTFLEQGHVQHVPEAAAIVCATADGLLVLAPASGKHIQSTLAVVQHPEWKSELVSTPNRGALTAVLADKLRPILVSRSTNEWIRRFSDADVPVAPVLSRAEHLSDAQVVTNGLYGIYAHPEFGPVRAARYPVRFAGARSVEPLPFPAPDEHRNEIIGQLTRQR